MSREKSVKMMTNKVPLFHYARVLYVLANLISFRTVSSVNYAIHLEGTCP
jgi:hypothetical protein